MRSSTSSRLDNSVTLKEVAMALSKAEGCQEEKIKVELLRTTFVTGRSSFETGMV